MNSSMGENFCVDSYSSTKCKREFDLSGAILIIVGISAMVYLFISNHYINRLMHYSLAAFAACTSAIIRCTNENKRTNDAVALEHPLVHVADEVEY
jgi:hypothetical protein